jgi:hypothetical protein
MKIQIKAKKRILIYIIFCLIFSFSNEIVDLKNNKKILTYEIRFNARDFEKYAFEIKRDPFNLIKKNMTDVNFFKDFNEESVIFANHIFIFFHPHDHSEENIMALTRNYIKSNMKYKFQEFIDEKNFNNVQKNIMLSDFYKNLKLSFLIEKKSGIMTNEIAIKTFAPRIFEEFFLSFTKDINEYLVLSWHLNANKIVLDNIKIEFMNKVSESLIELANKNIIFNSTINDTYKNLENLDFFESDELIKICKFLDKNHYEIKSPKKFVNDLEKIKKVQIEELFERKQNNFIKFIKKSEDKFIDVYNIWTLIIISIFLSFTVEILYRKIIK